MSPLIEPFFEKNPFVHRVTKTAKRTTKFFTNEILS